MVFLAFLAFFAFFAFLALLAFLAFLAFLTFLAFYRHVNQILPIIGDKHVFLKMKIMALTSAFVRTFFTLPGRLRVKPLGVAVPELEREISLLVGPELRSNFLKRSFCVLDNLRTSGRCPPNESGIFLCFVVSSNYF